MKKLALAAVAGVCFCLGGCAVTTIEGDLKAGTFKVSSPKDGSLKGLEIVSDPKTGALSLKLKSADYDATSPARVQVDMAGSIAEGVAAGMVKGAK
jgi:hypothetical protein